MDKEIEKLKLLKYELPTVAEFISVEWMQNIVAKYCAWKINRKMVRYNKRIERENYIKKTLLYGIKR